MPQLSPVTIPAVCFYILSVIVPAACNAPENSHSTSGESVKPQRVMKAFGDSLHIGMKSLKGFRPNNKSYLLCQHWELKDIEDASSNKLMWKNGNGDRLYQELILFKDFTAIQNPRNGMKTGNWSLLSENGRNWLELNMKGYPSVRYSMPLLSSTSLLLRWRSDGDSLYMKLRSDGIVHESRLNDPFYIENIRWMLAPKEPETKKAVKERVLDCIKFYALYYRDNIKREKKEINFAGLPEIFIWYNRGIGLPDKEEVSDSWINCFFNKDQALQAYDMLKRLLVDNNFNWPKNAQGWTWETESVLEQMYQVMRNPRL